MTLRYVSGSAEVRLLARVSKHSSVRNFSVDSVTSVYGPHPVKCTHCVLILWKEKLFIMEIILLRLLNASICFDVVAVGAWREDWHSTRHGSRGLHSVGQLSSPHEGLSLRSQSSGRRSSRPYTVSTMTLCFLLLLCVATIRTAPLLGLGSLMHLRKSYKEIFRKGKQNQYTSTLL